MSNRPVNLPAYSVHTPTAALNSEPRTFDEAMVAAKLNYDVALAPLQTAFNVDDDKNDGGIVIPGGLTVPYHFATVRTDSMTPIGVVGNKYKVVQNRTALSVFDGILNGEKGDFECGGTFGGGGTAFLQLKTPEFVQVNLKGKIDRVDQFILGRTSHDGSSSVFLGLTPIRVRCYNTLSNATNQSQLRINVRHTASAELRLREGAEALGILTQQFVELGKAYQRLGDISINQQQVSHYLKCLFPKPSKDEVASTKLVNLRRGVFETLETSEAMTDYMRGTGWGLYNAVTEFVDHKRSPGQDPEARLKSIWLGSGADLKDTALRLALYAGDHELPETMSPALMKELSRVPLTVN